MPKKYLTNDQLMCILYTLIMATLQKRTSRGHTYWSIVESRRVNGKPRPVILLYLGTAESLLKRLREGIPQKVRSYSHGIVAVMLAIAKELQIVETINRYVPSKQKRDGLTVGASLLLAAIGRMAHPTSKRNWYEGWARTTSLSYLLGISLKKLDSQHFWDQMSALPSESVAAIEEQIVSRLIEKGLLSLETLFYDTTNFFTYIDSTNGSSHLAQRGRNKQKRMDLRQFGLMLLLSRREQLPIFHKVYRGNASDSRVFKEHFQDILHRFKAISGSLEQITLIFDQGNNSKKMLERVDNSLHFVGALSPYQHKQLIDKANRSLTDVSINGKPMAVYRARQLIWDMDLTVVVYVSEKLRQGQIQGTEQAIKKTWKQLALLQQKIKSPTQRGRKRTQQQVETRISAILTKTHLPKNLLKFRLIPLSKDSFDLDFWIDPEQYHILKEQWFGRRILITNRHDWSTEQIIQAYWGQSHVEWAFKTIKNPFHLSLIPQYHWTDQKIEVHAFICLLAFLLTMIAYNRAKEKGDFKGSPQTFLEKLSAIRLATFIENPAEKSKGKYKATYRLEEMDEDIQKLAQAFDLDKLTHKIKIPLSVYI